MLRLVLELPYGLGAHRRSGLLDGSEDVVGFDLGSAAGRAPGRRPNCALRWATSAKSAGVNPAVRSATVAGVTGWEEFRGQLGPLRLVWCSDRNDQIEPPGSKERRIHGGDRVRGHDHQAGPAGT